MACRCLAAKVDIPVSGFALSAASSCADPANSLLVDLEESLDVW
jgi:hypothetical protein